MATENHKIKDGTVTHQSGPEIRDAVYQKVLEFMLEQACFNGECAYQCDGISLDGPELFADLADNIFKFDATWDDE